MKQILMILMASLSVSAFSAEVTAFRNIAAVQISASGTVYFVAKPAGWGAPSCPNATYAHYNKASNIAAEEFLSLALTAKAAGYLVAFNGDCSADGNYVSVNYIKVKDAE